MTRSWAWLSLLLVLVGSVLSHSLHHSMGETRSFGRLWISSRDLGRFSIGPTRGDNTI